MTLTIHPDLRSLIPPLAPEELAQLEANLLAEGCRDPLIVWRWQGEEILLDGHNRHDLCQRHGLPYRTQELSLPDLDAAKAWMIANQLGRRNLTPEQMSYYRGEQYNLEKQQGKRTDLGNGDAATSVKITEVSPEYVRHARTVLRFTPEAGPRAPRATVPGGRGEARRTAPVRSVVGSAGEEPRRQPVTDQ